MNTLLEHLKKFHELLGLQKSVSAINLTLGSPKSNVGIPNIVYKQKTGHTASVPKKTESSTTIKPVADIKPISNSGTKHLRLGNNQATGVS